MTSSLVFIFLYKMDLNYERENKGYDDQYPDGGVKFKNYMVCDTVLPNWWFDCKGCYLCTNCDMLFGTLTVVEDSECPICLERTKCITQPRCEHFVCICCFKRCYYGDESCTLVFPYADIEQEYYEDQENPKWIVHYPLIETYEKEYDQWHDEQEGKREREDYLRKCPLCRK
jgi:hypothetical protein